HPLSPAPCFQTACALRAAPRPAPSRALHAPPRAFPRAPATRHPDRAPALRSAAALANAKVKTPPPPKRTATRWLPPESTRSSSLLREQAASGPSPSAHSNAPAGYFQKRPIPRESTPPAPSGATPDITSPP